MHQPTILQHLQSWYESRLLLKTTEKCNLKVEEEVFVEAKNGDASLLSISMAEEEEKLLKSRMKEEEIEKAAEAQLDGSQFNKLDQLSTQTQLCSEFLLEKIDQITANGAEQESEAAEQKERGRVSKRRAAAEYNSELVLPNLLNAGGDVKEMEGQSRRQQPITPFLLGRNHQPTHSPRSSVT